MNAGVVKVDHAVELAREEWGDVPLERIELKHEDGSLVYKIKCQGGAELWIDALTGIQFTKGSYAKSTAASGQMNAGTFDWGKLLLDLHTGKIGGEIGKAVMTCAAVMLLFLTGSGVYLWCKPLLIRRRKAKPSPLAIEENRRCPVAEAGTPSLLAAKSTHRP